MQSFSRRNHSERSATAINPFLRGDAVALFFVQMRGELLSRVLVDSTAENGAVYGDDLNQLLTMRACDKKHSCGLLVETF